MIGCHGNLNGSVGDEWDKAKGLILFSCGKRDKAFSFVFEGDYVTLRKERSDY